MWMTHEEYREIMRERDETIDWMIARNGILDDDDSHCTLGLENSVDADPEQKCRRRSSKEAVFSEQKTQFHDGYFCEDLIAETYMEYTDDAHVHAHQRGVKIRNDIKRYIESSDPEQQLEEWYSL